jgi:hypothetical protein
VDEGDIDLNDKLVLMANAPSVNVKNGPKTISEPYDIHPAP